MAPQNRHAEHVFGQIRLKFFNRDFFTEATKYGKVVHNKNLQIVNYILKINLGLGFASGWVCLVETCGLDGAGPGGDIRVCWRALPAVNYIPRVSLACCKFREGSGCHAVGGLKPSEWHL